MCLHHDKLFDGGIPEQLMVNYRGERKHGICMWSIWGKNKETFESDNLYNLGQEKMRE